MRNIDVMMQLWPWPGATARPWDIRERPLDIRERPLDSRERPLDSRERPLDFRKRRGGVGWGGVHVLQGRGVRSFLFLIYKGKCNNSFLHLSPARYLISYCCVS